MAEPLHCWQCSKQLIDLPLPLSRHANCEHCYEVLHCCRFCKHFDARNTSSCFDDRADVPTNKESANFCEYLSINTHAKIKQKIPNSSKSKFDALFDNDDDTAKNAAGDLEDDLEESEPNNPLDDLFHD